VDKHHYFIAILGERLQFTSKWYVSGIKVFKRSPSFLSRGQRPKLGWKKALYPLILDLD
jgi:hypothetical protein